MSKANECRASKVLDCRECGGKPKLNITTINRVMSLPSGQHYQYECSQCGMWELAGFTEADARYRWNQFNAKENHEQSE